MNRAVFLDRDGTINDDTSYLNKPEELRLLPNVVKGLKKLQDYGFKLVIITNQSGIGRGYFTEAQLLMIHKHLVSILKRAKINISKIYYAPHYKESADHRYRKGEHYRKPNPGMLVDAAEDLDIELTASYVIGDKESDIGAGYNSGLKGTILVKGKYKYRSEKYKPHKKVKDLVEAADFIIRKEEASRIITDPLKLKKIVQSHKKKGTTIVTTNGVFDILHIGHIRYLNECKKDGNVLIVGLNSNSSVRMNKGEKRPIIDQFARAEMMANLRSVDYVFIFDQKDPREFLKIVRPDVHVKAGDYSLKQIIEQKVVASSGGIIKISNFTKGYSTTGIIKKIKDNEKKN